jgi:hypothetical protein
MKRSKLFLLSLFSLMLSGTAWAQDSSTETGSTDGTESTESTPVNLSTSYDDPEYIYEIHGGRQDESTYWGSLGEPVSSTKSSLFAFYSSGTEGEYYIYCLTSGMYLTYDQSSSRITDANSLAYAASSKETAHCWKIAKGTGDGEGYWQFQAIDPSATSATTKFYYANWFGGKDYATHTSIGLYQKNAANDKGSAWTVVSVDKSNVAKVTYSVGSSSYTRLVKKGNSYPLSSSDYYTVSSTAESVSGDETVTVTQNTPFTISASYDNATWYTMSIHKDKYKIYYEVNDAQMALTRTTTNWSDNDLFCFVGDVVGGFKIYNKAAGNAMVLSSAFNINSSNEKSTYAVMTAEETAKTQSYLWDATKSKDIDGGFYLGQHGASKAKMNRNGGNLTYWFGNQDGGSTFTIVSPVISSADDAAYTEIDEEYLTNGNLGYPKATAEATTKLKSAMDAFKANAGDQTTSIALRQAYAAYTNCTDVVLPEAKKFYTLLCTTGNRYVLSTLSSNSSYSTKTSTNDASRLATSATDAASTADCIFYYDGTNMMGYNNGYYVAMNGDGSGFLTQATVGATSGTKISFGSASVTEGSLYVNFNDNGRGLYAANDGYVNAQGANSKDAGCRFKVTEITSLPLTIGTNGWSSFSAPVAVCKPTGDNVKVYYAPTAPAEGKLVLTELTGDVIPASTGVLVSGTAGEVVNFSTNVTGEATALTDNKLVCNWYVNTVGNSDETTAKTDGKYALATKTNSTTQEKTTGFMKLLTAVTLPGHKCYLQTSTSATSAQFVPISLTDDPTGIESAETTTASDINAPIYDLQGRKVNGTQKGGMYIQNGKVFIAM